MSIFRFLSARRVLLTGALGTLVACGGEPTARIAAPDVASPSRTSADPTQTIVVTWSSATLDAIRVTKVGPPIAARALAIVHTAIYDAWAAYDARAVGTRLGGSLRRPARERTDANKKKALSFAAYRALVDVFPTMKPTFDAVMASEGYDPADPSTPAAVGNAAAAALLEYRHRDGSNQLGDLHAGAYSDWTGYTATNTPDLISDPTRWQPLRFVNAAGILTVQTFLAPHWGRVTPFAMASGSMYRPRIVQKLYPFSGVEKEVDTVLEYSRTLGDREKVIAEYWADGPASELPPGHWCLFGAYVSQRDHHTLDEDTKMFFALANAVLDASIASWDSKRFFDSIRPVSAVHYYKAGQMVTAWAGPYQGVKSIPAEQWMPYQPSTFPTPPFPEYFSGHSAFSASAAEILRRFTGSDRFGMSVTVPAHSSRVEPLTVPAADVALNWPTFSAAADEAGLSRRYGGIHFVPGDLLGRAIGRLIGAQTYEKAEQYFNGTAR